MTYTKPYSNPWSDLFFDWPKEHYTSTSTWKKNTVTVEDGKAEFYTPGANKENLSVSFVDGVLELAWPGAKEPHRVRYTVTSGIEPVEAVVKDGITTVSFSENKKTIVVK